MSPASSWFACGAVTFVDLLRFLMLLHNCCCLVFLKTNRCVGLGLSLSFPAQFSHLVWDPLTMGQGLCATVPVSPAPPPIPQKGPPAAAEGHPRPLSPPDLSCSVCGLVSPPFYSVGLYAHCHWRCPPCLIRRYRVVLVYSRINSKVRGSGDTDPYLKQNIY